MVQLVTRRSALALYGVLLVLPTIVLGALLWHRLEEDHAAEMASVPGDTMNAQRRLLDALEQRLHTLLDQEGRRAFYFYKRNYYPPGTIGQAIALMPSPLAADPLPEGILAWFTYPTSRPRESEIEILGGAREAEAEWVDRRADLEQATVDLAHNEWGSRKEGKDIPVGRVRLDPISIAIAAINVSMESDPQCLNNEIGALRRLENEDLIVNVTTFNVRFYRDSRGIPRVVATRRVGIDEITRLQAMPACFDRLGWGYDMIQGFYIDPDWIFSKLPQRLAASILDPSQEFIAAGSGSLESQSENYRVQYPAGAVFAEILPVKELEFDTLGIEDETFGRMRIVGTTADLEQRFDSQELHFFSVAAMLVLSLGTGLVLLLRSVRRDLEAAERTENFVAAVTHELRTPLSAIRMHGEMLREGWVQDDEKRREYYRRIVRETDRLETMVERVLEKSRLSTADATPEPGNVNAIIEGLGPALIASGTEHPAPDVVFDLEPGLPEALVVPEGVRSIVTNLVENARKYAPVDPSKTDAEPIRVATRLENGSPVLEVRDRGPGIPQVERSRIFDAFYRVGNERTRTTKGTGLGLHLAALHCDVMGARIQALDRDGGGTVFRVTFQPT